MEERQYTIEEVLEMTVKQLYAISVPVELIEQIGMPISMAIGNLKNCLDAMNRQKEQAEHSEQDGAKGEVDA